MSHATLADGSPIPNYLTQSPNTPFSVGKVLSIKDKMYGFSGMIDYDVTVAASYPMLNFLIERDAIIKVQFGCNWDIIADHGIGTGFDISIDNLSVMKWIIHPSSSGGTSYGWNGIPEFTFFAPQNRECNIILLNPHARSELINANINLLGEYL
tara:strand:+ start:644 stop:1105 length:462 start_codon:yes stop_codon:yes gene_type:complete